MAARIFAVILLFGCIALGWWGFSLAAEQHRKIRTFLPAKARIVAASIKEHVTHDRHGRHVSYEPIIHYTYVVGDRTFSGQTVQPYSQRGSSSWARGIVARYPVNSSCEAYYDPGNPSSSFLIRHYAFLPYMVLLIAGALGTVSVGMLFLGGISLKTMPAPTPVGQNLFRLSPKLSISRRLNGWSSAALVAIVVAVMTCGHYLAVADAKETSGIVCTLLAGIVCAPLAFMTVRYWMLSREITDAAVVIDSLQIRCGQRLNMRVQQRLMTSAMVEELSLDLLCIETYQTSGSKKRQATRKVYDQSFPLLANRSTQAGEILDAACEIQIPTATLPSTPSRQKGFPRFEWRLCVKTKLAAMPDYSGEYPIFVLPPDGQALDALEAVGEV